MKLFYYSKNNLLYQEIPSWKVLVVLLSILLVIPYSILKSTSIKENTNLNDLELELVVININDTLNNFSEDRLIDMLKSLNVKFPHIVLAQSKLESGNYTSNIFKHNHNLFGMKEARVRIHTSTGTQHSHAYYTNWRESVYDYAFYQCRYLSKIHTEDEYYSYLNQSYAEASNYTKLLRVMVNKEKLKEKFKD